MKIYFKTRIILLLIIFIGCQSSRPNKRLNPGKSVIQKNVENAPNSEGLRYFMNGQMLMNQGDFAMAII